MEEIQAYIENGILELYAIGDLTPDEMREVERMAQKHPEVKAELIKIQKALEGYADAYSIKPKEHLRERILNSMVTPIESMDSKPEAAKREKEEQNLIVKSISRPNLFYKYAFAACLSLLILSFAALFILFNRLQNSNQQLAALQAGNQTFANQVNYIKTQLSESQQALSILRDPEVKLIKLEGTAKAPLAKMMIAFNPVKAEVMIDMSAMNLPVNDQEHQYQLWALVNGKPVDLGVFDMESDSIGMKKMKAIGEAQAFAVTLEPRGGSVIPTMEQMMVMGKI